MLIRHSLLYAVAKFIPGLLGMATTAFLTRYLNPQEYGLYGLALIIMTFGSTTVFDWLGVSFMRFYQGRRDDPRVIGTFVSIFLSLVALTGSLTWVARITGLLSGQHAAVWITGVAMMWCYAWFELVSRFQIANFRPTRYLVMNIGRGLFCLIGATGAAFLTRDPTWTAAGLALGTMLGALLGGSAWCSSVIRIDRSLARAVIVFGLPMAVSMSMSSVVSGGTRALVELLDSPAALGFYTAAFMLVQNSLVVVANGVASAGYSLAVRAVESDDPEAVQRQLMDNGALLLAVLAPAALGMTLTAHQLAATLVDTRYVAEVARLTPWMAIGTFFGAFRGNHLDHAFQLGRRPALQIWVTGTAAVISIALCLVLIPIYGSIGAAVATSVAMAASCVVAYRLGQKAYHVPLPLGPLVRVTAACSVMAVVVMAVPDDITSAFAIKVVAGGAAYTVSVFALDILGMRQAVCRAILVRFRPSGVW